MRVIETRRDATHADVRGKGVRAILALRDETRAKLKRAVEQGKTANGEFRLADVTEVSGTPTEKRELLAAMHSDLAGYEAALKEAREDEQSIAAIEQTNDVQSGGPKPDPVLADLGGGQRVAVSPTAFARVPGVAALPSGLTIDQARDAQAHYLTDRLFTGLGLEGAVSEDAVMAAIGRSVSVDDFAFGDLSPQAAVFKRDTGWAPEVIRSGRVEIAPVYRRARIVNFIPSIPVMTSGYRYTRTTRRSIGRDNDEIAQKSNAVQNDNTAGSLATAENAELQESALRFGDADETIRDIGTHIPMTLQQLQDVPGAQAYVRRELFDLLQMELDYQLFSSVYHPTNGPSNVNGFLSRTGTGFWDIPTVALANSVVSRAAAGGGVVADNNIQAMMTFYAALSNAVDDIMFDGDADADMCLVHRTLYSALRTAIDKDGNFIFGPPNMAAPMAVWGVPMRIHQHFPALADSSKCAMVGQFGQRCAYLDRRGAMLEMSRSHDKDFTNLRVRILVWMRGALAVFRGKAFKVITAGSTQ